MHSFDPRDWWGLGQGSADHGAPQGNPNLDRLLILGLVAATCFCLASFAPPPLVPLVAAELLVLAAHGSALEALLRGERLFQNRLSAWDQAAVLLAAALLLRLLFGAPPGVVSEEVTAGMVRP
jgi:hypothetical protein